MSAYDLESWGRDALLRPRATLEHAVRVVGLCARTIGGRQQSASITVVVEPSPSWAVAMELDEQVAREMARDALDDAAVFGMLDVLVTEPEMPLVNVLVRIVEAKIDGIASSEHAFRMAGRSAARELLRVAGPRVRTVDAIR